MEAFFAFDLVLSCGSSASTSRRASRRCWSWTTGRSSISTSRRGTSGRRRLCIDNTSPDLRGLREQALEARPAAAAVAGILNLASACGTPLTFVEEHLEVDMDARSVPVAVQRGQLAFTIVTVSCVRWPARRTPCEAFPQRRARRRAPPDQMTVDYVI